MALGEEGQRGRRAKGGLPWRARRYLSPRPYVRGLGHVEICVGHEPRLREELREVKGVVVAPGEVQAGRVGAHGPTRCDNERTPLVLFPEALGHTAVRHNVLHEGEARHEHGLVGGRVAEQGQYVVLQDFRGVLLPHPHAHEDGAELLPVVLQMWMG